MSDLTFISDTVGLDKLAAGWSFFSPIGSKISFHYMFGELRALAEYADNANLVLRTFVAYDEPTEAPHLEFLCQLQTPDGFTYSIYEEHLWGPAGQPPRDSLEASYAAS